MRVMGRLIGAVLIVYCSSSSGFFEPTLMEGADSAQEENYNKVVEELKRWAKGNKPDKVRAVLEGQAGPERDKFIKDLNRMLKAYSLPLINNSDQLSIKRVCMIGIVLVKDCFDGIEINDGKNRFCFPCDRSRNDFIKGIRPASYKEEGKTGDLFQKKSPSPEGRN